MFCSLGKCDTLAVMSNGTFVEAVDTTAGARVEKGPESSLTSGGVRWWRVCVCVDSGMRKKLLDRSFERNGGYGRRRFQPG